MTGFEAYNLFICIFVYVLLTLLFSFLIGALVRSQLRLIRAGLEDEQIKQEHEKAKKEKKKGRVYNILPVLCCALLTVVFLFSLYGSITQDSRVGKIPAVKVVSSGSMSAKYEQNKYLFENDLNNQLQVFDLIVLHALPAEKDLCLYDIVVYEVGDMHLVHRIVGIEEPNEKHPDEYYFLMQGDNVQYPDKFPVRYSQMRSIYRNERVPFLGSFVFFMQSPAGALCFLLAIAGVIAALVIEKKFNAAVQERVTVLYPPALEQSDAVAVANVGFYATAQRRSFADKLTALTPERKAWLEGALSLLDGVPRVSIRRGKQAITYLHRGKPLARVTVSRGYAYVYLAVDPARYADRKYGVKDVSGVKTYAKYPARLKLTSRRKLKYLEQMLNERSEAPLRKD